MPYFGRMREVEIATADTRTNMTTMNSNSTPGTLRAPDKATKVAKLWSGVGCETPTLADGGGSVFLRLWGEAIHGEHVIPLCGFAIGGVTAGETGSPGTNVCIPVDIAVKTPSADYNMAAECGGVEAHNPSVVVNLIFK